MCGGAVLRWLNYRRRMGKKKEGEEGEKWREMKKEGSIAIDGEDVMVERDRDRDRCRKRGIGIERDRDRE